MQHDGLEKHNSIPLAGPVLPLRSIEPAISPAFCRIVSYD
jgi:hypothetical protein